MDNAERTGVTKVWLVYGRWDYEGDDLKGAFASEEGAKKYVEKHWKAPNHWVEDNGDRRRYDSVHIWDEEVQP